MTMKELRLEYSYRGMKKHLSVRENALLMLPEAAERTAAVPDYE
jgi:hypothetical protein